jgi:hypothetical protein
MSLREDQIIQAVKFLTDSRTQSASTGDKESFLRHKGLTEPEIAAAMQRAAAVPFLPRVASASSMNMEEPILWAAIKSIFSALGAMAIGVIGYQAYQDATRVTTTGVTPAHLDVSGDDRNSALIGSEAEERIMEVIRQMKADQALRHTEILQRLREVSELVRESKGSNRKAGVSVVLDHNVSTVEEKVESATPSTEAVNTRSESFVIADLVAKAIAAGQDSTLILVLSSIDKNKRLNKLNQRFAKLAGSALLKYCGYNETDEFFEMGKDPDAYVRATEVVDELRKQRSALDSSKPAIDVDAKPLPPWMLTSSSMDADTSIEKIVELGDS